MTLEKNTGKSLQNIFSDSPEPSYDMARSRNQNLTFRSAARYFSEHDGALSPEEMAALRLVTDEHGPEEYAAIGGRADGSYAGGVGRIGGLYARDGVASGRAPCPAAQAGAPARHMRQGMTAGGTACPDGCADGEIKPPDGMWFTNAAFLISDQCGYETQCAVFGEKIGRGGIRKTYGGSLLQQYNDVYEYAIMKSEAFERQRNSRIRDGAFPDALREFILNAIVHRDYNDAGRIQINIYDGRVDITSPGGLVKGATMRDVLNGAASMRRNEVLAGVFGRLGFFSGTGGSIRRFISDYSGCLIEPVFRKTPSSFSVSLPRMIGGAMPLRGNLHFKEEMVLKAIAHKGSITRAEVEEILKSSRNTAITLLDGLIDEGKIVKIGTVRTVRYILPQ